MAALVAALLAVIVVAPARAAAPDGPEARVLQRAINLLPTPPAVPVRSIHDPDLAADSEAVRRWSPSRTARLRRVIHLNRRSAVVEHALGGRDLDSAIFASVILHEMKHLRGIFEGPAPFAEGVACLCALEQHYPLREE